MGDDSDKLTVADGDAAAIAVVSTALGFPVPATIAKNVLQGMGALIAGSFDVGRAWLEGKAGDIRAETQARAALTARAVEIAAEKISEDPEFAVRATMNLGHRLLRQQKTREKIARDALEDLKHNRPTSDAPGPVDPDWFDLFARHSETKTNVDVQAYFAKVLSGEIRKPGSFAPETIEVLSRLSPGVAKLFQEFCALTMRVPGAPPFVLAQPYGAPGTNALGPVGFFYSTICRLQDAGLVRPDVTTFYTLAPLNILGATVGNRPLYPMLAIDFSKAPPPPSALAEQQMSALNLTQAGAEISSIVDIAVNEIYLAKVVEWLAGLLRPSS